MATEEIARVMQGGLLMGTLVVVIGGIPRQTVPGQAQQEQPKHHHAETIIP